MPKDTPYTQPAPFPDAGTRIAKAQKRRNLANAANAAAVTTTHNGEAEAFAGTWPTNFSKGLPHDNFGIVNPAAYASYFQEVADPTYVTDGGQKIAPFDVPRYCGAYLTRSGRDQTPFEWRAWESPIAGHQFVLEGPDPAAVGMAPAPRLGSDELAAEMAEVYAMAQLRDTPFETMRSPTGQIKDVVKALSQMTWFREDRVPKDADGSDIGTVSAARRARDGGALSGQSLFRGSSPGCATGPYLSQFMLQGHNQRGQDETEMKSAPGIPAPTEGEDHSAITAKDGLILFGAQRIDQRIEPQEPCTDYLRDWAEWLDVQNGADTKKDQAFRNKGLKFIATPRDLATYVHFDALYQAYLNACLLMLGWETPSDEGLPEHQNQSTRDPFATWGGPHILTLVTETASRALRAVRRQKFQIHNRARPEKLGSVASLVTNGHGMVLGAAEPFAKSHLQKLESASYGDFSLMEAIAAMPTQRRFTHGPGTQDGLPDNSRNLLLPMAYPEGSPMHPAYGAGHATVAGACVTVLKAFFRTHAADGTALSLRDAGARAVYVPDADGETLIASPYPNDNVDSLTLNGELNKLAANISIGRNMAGVHFYSDYFDSIRMGERIAVGILTEQMVTYSESLSMTLETFDGDRLTILGDGEGGARFDVQGSTAKSWWTRHLPTPAREPSYV